MQIKKIAPGYCTDVQLVLPNSLNKHKKKCIKACEGNYSFNLGPEEGVGKRGRGYKELSFGHSPCSPAQHFVASDTGQTSF